MKQIIFKTLAAALVGLTTLVSCKKEPIPQIGTTEVTFSFRINDPGTDPNTTKSAISSDEEALKVIHVAFYNSSNGVREATSVFTANSFTMAPVPNVNCDVLAMANLESADFEWPETLSEAMAIEKAVSVESINSAGIPMAGKASWSAGTTSVTVGLDRLVSRYDVTANKTFSYGTWNLTSVTFSNAANTVTPFKANTAPTSKGTFDYATSTDVSNLNGGTVASFYLPEMIGSTAQIKIEGEWTATGMKRTASYELGVGSDNNKRNMKYQVKLNADSSNPVWSVTIGDDQLNDRFVYSSANPLVVTTNGASSTTTLTASSADLPYRLEAASSTADYATAALSFSTDGTTWHSYTNLPNLIFSGSVPTLYVKSGYTGTSVIDVPFRYVSADGKVLPAAANQSADGNTLNVSVRPMAHISTITFKVNNSNIPWYKATQVGGLNDALVGNSGHVPFGKEIKIPYDCDVDKLNLTINFSPFVTAEQTKVISLTAKLNGETIKTVDDFLAGQLTQLDVDLLAKSYGENLVFEFEISTSGTDNPSSFSSYEELGYYKEVMQGVNYTGSVVGSVSVSGTSNVSGLKSGNTITYKSNGAVGTIEQLYIIDNEGHYCHTMLLKSTPNSGSQIGSATVNINNNSTVISDVDISTFTLVINKENYNLVKGSNTINSYINEEVKGSLILTKSDTEDVSNNLHVKIGGVNAYSGTITWPNSIDHDYSHSNQIEFTIPLSEAKNIGNNPTITITVDD